MKLSRNTWIVIAVVVAVLVLCPTVTAAAAYFALNNPDVKQFVQGAADAFGDMVALQQEVAAEYPAEAVQIQIQNGDTLGVGLVNSQWGKADKDEQARTAEDIARFVVAHYAGIDAVTRVEVTFTQQAEALGVNVNTSHTYVFDVSDLK